MLYFKTHYPTIDSTNDEAKRLLQGGANEGTVVWADQQTSGRGRQGRRWISSSGNLFTSVILKPLSPLETLGQLSFVVGLAVHQALSTYLGDLRTLKLKWPNDVLINDCKVSGILVESDFNGQELNGVIVGIGINLVQAPDRVTFPATALCDHLGKCVLPHDMLEEVLCALDQTYQLWTQYGFLPIREQWLTRAYGIGKYMTVSSNGEITEGYFRDLSPEGALVLERIDNTLVTFNAAEILPNGHALNII